MIDIANKDDGGRRPVAVLYWKWPHWKAYNPAGAFMFKHKKYSYVVSKLMSMGYDVKDGG